MKDDVTKVVEYCISTLNFDQPLASEYDYKNVPFCVIDSVFSIGVKYESVQNVIKKAQRFLQEEGHFDNQFNQLTTSSYLEIIKGYSYDELAGKIYNRQRTSTSNGILKAEAVSHFLEVLKKYNVERIEDIPGVYNNPEFENEIIRIKGQGTGLTLKYFYMLSGYNDLIKPDRMIIRFLKNITGRELSFDEVAKILLAAAKEISDIKNKVIAARHLDNIIWKYERDKGNEPKTEVPIIGPRKKDNREKITEYAPINVDEIAEKIVKAIDKMKGLELTGAFDDVDYPIGSELYLSITRDKTILTYQNMGATIIDTILQAGVNYRSVVKPRIERFRKEHPGCKTTKDFLEIINKTSVNQLIDWKEGAKPNRIRQLTEMLNRINIQTERELLIWLKDTKNCDRIQAIKGIKEKTTDYLKMMCGDPKGAIPNVHVKSFITKYGGEELPDESIVEVVLNVARRLNIVASSLDYSIWKFMSKK